MGRFEKILTPERVDEPAGGPTEDEIRKNPMTMTHFRSESRSAHAFWSWALDPSCHPKAGTHSKLLSHGTVEMTCQECGKLIGCLKIDQGDGKWLGLLGKLKAWQMWAITREAFVCQAGLFLNELGIDTGESFHWKLLGVPKTSAVDDESCKTRLDEAFAGKTLKLVDRLLKKAGKR